MKTLGLAFAIVAVAGSVMYFLLAVVLQAEGFAGAFSGLLFATLPFIHQELEKRAAARVNTLGVAPTNQPITGTPPAPYSHQPQPPAHTNPLSPPDTSSLTGATPTTQVSTAPPVQPASGVLPANQDPPQVVAQQDTQHWYPNPVPVYVPSTSRATPAAQPAPAAFQPVAVPASRIRKRSPAVLLAYGIAITIALRSASILIGNTLWSWLFNLFYNSDQEFSDFQFAVMDFAESILPFLVVAIGVFILGRWIGARSDTRAFLITLGAVVLGLAFSRLLNLLIGYNDSGPFVVNYLVSFDQYFYLRFEDPDAYRRVTQPLSGLVFFGALVFESLVAIVGCAIGSRLRR